MANISPQHIQPLTAGYVGLLVGSLLILALLNAASNRAHLG